MRGLLILLLSFLTVSSALASSDWIYGNSATFVFQVSESAKLVRYGDNPYVELVRGYLDFFPRNDSRQQVELLVTFPASLATSDSLEYAWMRPAGSELVLSLYSQITTSSKSFRVKDRVAFPQLTTHDKYVSPSSSIDSDNDEIRGIASELAADKDDLYEVVFAMADWVSTNIRYEMTPETRDFAQKSSWVMENRVGVCDEITSLFIALLRSVGIQAKYISGFAYSTNDTGAPHAWAEVFFPGYGWIPFDVTNGQFGYVDVSHIKLKESVDSAVPTSRYEWKAHNVDLFSSPLRLNCSLIEASGKVATGLQISLEPYSSRMAPGSYNYIEAKLLNPNGYYVSSQLRVTAPAELEVSPSFVNVVLHPYESKSVYWQLRLSGALSEDYMYTLPFVLHAGGNSSTTLIVGSKDSPRYSNAQIDEILRMRQPTPAKKSNGNLILRCSPGLAEYYTDEAVEIDCWAKNVGNSRPVKVCSERDCRILGTATRVAFRFPALSRSTSLGFTAQADKLFAQDKVFVQVLPTPNVTIGEVEHPKVVSYKENYFLSFDINKQDGDDPQQLLVIVNTKETTKSWEFQDFNESRNFIVEMSGSALRSGRNPVKIVVSYYDRHKHRFKDEREVNIQLENIPLLSRMRMLYTDFIESLFR
jgi:transglutaminase-like putative cysteine protease